MRKIDLNGVGVRVRALRESLDLTGADFATAIGIDPSSLSKIEQGKKALRAEMAFQIAETWSVPMDYLYRGRMVDIPQSLESKLLNRLTQGQR